MTVTEPPGGMRRLLELAAAVADGQDLARTHPGNVSSTTEANLQQLALLAKAMRGYVNGVDGPMRWGHLELGEVLGSGSFGRVYSAFDPVLQRAVALKLRREESAAADAWAYIEEARRMARVRHPHVLAVHGADIHGGVVGMWSDLIPGETLESVIAREGPKVPAEFMTLAEQIAQAVCAVHAAQLVHGDIKTSNVMIDPDRAAVLMDFGAGMDRAAGTGGGAGSPLAMAPEQLNGEAPSFASDVYALGVLYFRVLTGRYPLQADTLEQLRRLHQQPGDRQWRRLPGRAPAGLRALVAKMLASRPEERPDATAVLQQLRWLQAAPARRRRWLGVVAVVTTLSLALIAVSAAWWWTRQSEQRALKAQAETRTINDFLRDILASPRPTESGRNTLMVEVLDQAAQRLDERFSDQPRLADRIRAVLARSFDTLGRDREASALRTAIVGNPQTASIRDPQKAEVVYELALNLADQRKIDESRRLLDAVDHSAAPMKTPRLEIMRGCLEARLALNSGETRRALALARHTWANAREVLSRYDDYYTMSRYQLGRALNDLGQYDEANSHFQAALTDSIDTFGERHAATLEARQYLLIAAVRLGRFGEAESLARTNLQMAQAWLGENDRFAVTAMSSLANVLKERGKPDAAVEMNSRAVAAARIAYGENHPQFLLLLGNQANRVEELGRLTEAERLRGDVIERMRRLFGENDSVTLFNRGNQAETWIRLGHSAQAETELRDVVTRLREHYGLTSIGNLYYSVALARLLSARGAHGEALRWLTPSLEALKDASAMQSPRALDLLETVATEEETSGMQEAAMAHWRKLHALRLNLSGSENEKTLAAEAAIARLEAAGQHEKSTRESRKPD